MIAPANRHELACNVFNGHTTTTAHVTTTDTQQHLNTTPGIYIKVFINSKNKW